MKGLKVAHINVNGLFYKLHEIKLLLQETRLDGLAITETHLHKHIENDQLEIEGYGIARKDRQNSENNWGGCLIYFAEDLNAFEREDLISLDKLYVQALNPCSPCSECWYVSVHSQLLVFCYLAPYCLW